MHEALLGAEVRRVRVAQLAERVDVEAEVHVDLFFVASLPARPQSHTL